MMPISKRDRSKGFSLLEILVTIMILSIGLMGVVSLQLKGAESTNGAYFRSQATFIADELAERMHVNHVAVSNNSYFDIKVTPSGEYCIANRPEPFCESEKSSVAKSCNTAEMAAFDIFRAACDISERLPAGALAVTCEKNPLDENRCLDGYPYSITVSWSEVDDGKAAPSDVTIKVQP